MMRLPQYFCWTRFGTEAGQTSDQILSRKEQERAVNDGLFLWGIGNAVGPSIEQLLRRTPRPEVLFSPIKSAFRSEDTSPVSVVAWTDAHTIDGTPFKLPSQSLVTSRFDPSCPKKSHYALVCFVEQRLTEATPKGDVCFGDLRNLKTGRPVGASQVTAVVEHINNVEKRGASYVVAFRARLIPPYFIRLLKPVPISEGGASDWAEAVKSSWYHTMQAPFAIDPKLRCK